jgi:hypothetical protein
MLFSNNFLNSSGINKNSQSFGNKNALRSSGPNGDTGDLDFNYSSNLYDIEVYGDGSKFLTTDLEKLQSKNQSATKNFISRPQYDTNGINDINDMNPPFTSDINTADERFYPQQDRHTMNIQNYDPAPHHPTSNQPTLSKPKNTNPNGHPQQTLIDSAKSQNFDVQT